MYDEDVRGHVVMALRIIGSVETLTPALQHQNVRVISAFALGQIGTPEALKAVEEYQALQ